MKIFEVLQEYRWGQFSGGRFHRGIFPLDCVCVCVGGGGGGGRFHGGGGGLFSGRVGGRFPQGQISEVGQISGALFRGWGVQIS